MNAKLIIRLLLLGFGMNVSAAVHYVNVNSASPGPPYTNWAAAARNIQDAVDAATPGDEIVVTNGVYSTGGRTVPGSSLTNRVVVDRSVTVRSVNGPDVTVISGFQAPGTTNGDASIRCAYLANGALLFGFMLTNGATRSTGFFDTEQSGGGLWCESASATISNCIVGGNAASYKGGGAYQGTFKNCTLTGNSAGFFGGGVLYGTLHSCALIGNSAAEVGGGGAGVTLYNCTVTGNTAGHGGAGVSDDYKARDPVSSTLYNCILYYNKTVQRLAGDLWADNYADGTLLHHCCTTPQPPVGTGNIVAEPELASASHLSASSPCRNAGSAPYVSGADIDGEGWASPPSMGCDEIHMGSVTGALSTAIVASYTNVATGFNFDLQGFIAGRPSASRWEFGDGTILSNRPYASHAWLMGGDYTVVLRAYNDDHPSGVTDSIMIHVISQPVHHVSLTSPSPSPPYDSWATAATNIQDAVDAASVVGSLILVSNGVYKTGARAAAGTMTTNRLVMDKPVTVKSVNGPDVTLIQGYKDPSTGTNYGSDAIRCVHLASGAVLSGFTLTNGAARLDVPDAGGGIWCESVTATVSNCILTGNWAFDGGASYGGSLYNCALMTNWALHQAGGALESTLNDCTLVGNSADRGGGAYYGRLNHCTVNYNFASTGGGGVSYSILTHCTLSGNWAQPAVLPDAGGGGAFWSFLYNCSLTGNSAVNGGGARDSTLYNNVLTDNSSSYGGGVYGCRLSGCTLAGNSAGIGGGAFFSNLTNCIAFYNTAANGPNYNYDPGWVCSLSYCCTTPLPIDGVGNITDEPLFIDIAVGDLRLQSTSPCINAGNNNYALDGADLDGNHRIVSGTVDIGAYEFQSPQSLLSYAWLQQYGLPTDGSADFTDPDGDGHNNWQEWRAWTDPTNAASVLRLLSPIPSTNGIVVRWQSVDGQTYFLERSTNLAAGPSFAPLAENLVGQTDSTIFTDTNAVGRGPFFYRVGVR